MKKTIKTVALLAVLSVAAVGCQKETIVVPQTGVETVKEQKCIEQYDSGSTGLGLGDEDCLPQTC